MVASAEHFSNASRIWVYPCNRLLDEAETSVVQQQLTAFCRQWTAHNQALRAMGEVFKNRLVLLMVDETQSGASGCSIDKSVHFLENLGVQLGVDFFDRMQFAWVAEDGLLFGNKQAMESARHAQSIQDDTLMLNTLVAQKSDFAEKWLLPWRKSWHKRLL